MPLNRTPPKTDSPAPSVFKTPLQHSVSDPNLPDLQVQEHDSISATSSQTSSLSNITNRNSKRKRDEISKSEILDLFGKLRDDQDAKFSTILSSINEVKSSLNFMSQKFDEVLQRIDVLEEDKKDYNKKIEYLESKIDALERQTRYTSIELRNIPQDIKEAKEDLKSVVVKTAQVLKINLNSTEIKDIYRIGKSNNKTIIADFTTVFKKEEFIRSYKQFNKNHQSDKLNTRNINIAGQSQPIYISENLTQKNRRLFFLAREFAKNYEYAFCWLSFGKICLRKSEGSPVIRISYETDLEKLYPSNEQVVRNILSP